MEAKKRILDQIQIYERLITGGVISRQVKKTPAEIIQEDAVNRRVYIDKHKNRTILPDIPAEIELEAKAVFDMCVAKKKNRKNYVPLEWVAGVIVFAIILIQVWFLMAVLWLLFTGIGIGIGVYLGKFGYIENVVEQSELWECERERQTVIRKYRDENTGLVSREVLAEEYKAKQIQVYPYKTVQTWLSSRKAPKAHIKFFLRWWFTEMRNLVTYLDELAGGTQEFDTSVNLGTFEPNYSVAQKAILYQIYTTSADELLQIMYKYIQWQNNDKLLANKSAINTIKERVLQHFDPPTNKLDYTQAQDSEAFFLPRFRALVPFKARQRHAYIIGGSGSGKSELIKLFLYNDIQQSSGNLVIDPHGELAVELSALDLFAKHPDKLVYISPEFNDFLPHYNPLEYRYHHIKNEDKKLRLIQYRADQLTKAFSVIIGREFSMHMKNLIEACLMVLLHYEGMTLKDLMDFMKEEKNAKYIEMARKINDDSIRGFFSDGGDFFGKNYESSKSAVRARVFSLLSSGMFASIVNQEQSTFDFIQALEDGKTVILNLDTGIMGDKTTKAIGKFLFAEIMIWGFARPKSKNRSVFIYMDEVQYFVNPILSKALSEIRKYNIHLTIANQGLYQFDDEDLPTLKKAILTNTVVKFTGLIQEPGEQVKMTKATGGAVDVMKAQKELGMGKWIMRVPPRDAHIIHLDDFLIAGDGHDVLGKPSYMNKATYARLMNEQKQKYYYCSGEEQKPVQPQIESKEKHRQDDDRPLFDKMI